MATMKDIAKLANVSYGTVSNVLNKRGNVSLKKLKAVEEAANQLGYYINYNASELRSNKKADIAFIIPTLDNCMYRKLYNLLRKKCNIEDIKLNLYISEFNQDLEIEYAKLATGSNQYIIIKSCFNNIEDTYSSNLFNSSTLIFLNTTAPFIKQNLISINFDLKQMNDDIIKYCKQHNLDNVLFFSDYNTELSEEMESLVDYKQCNQPYNLSFALDSLTRNSYDLVVVTSIEKYKAISKVTNILQIKDEIKTIVITDDDVIVCEDALLYKLDIITLFSKISAVIDNEKQYNNIVIPYKGFDNIEREINKVEFINILMIESPATTAFLKVRPFIEKKLGFTINIDVINYNEYDTLLDEKTIKKYDMIRIDMAYLATMGKSMFKPLDKSATLIKDKLISNLDEYIYYDNNIYSLPFDIGCQIMMYREDIISNQIIKRTYYEATKNNNMLPNDYEEYNLLESFFNSNYSNKYKGSTVCTGARVTCGNEFLNRVHYHSVLQKDNTLNIKDVTVKRALDSYLTSVKHSTKENYFWDDVVKEYSEGNTVLSITFSNYIHLLKEYSQDVLYKTRYALPPNNRSLIGGGVIGLSKHTTKDSMCYEFFKTIYSNQISELLVHLGVAIPTKAIYNNINLISMYPWLSLIPTILENNTRKYYDKDGILLDSLKFEKKVGQEVKNYLLSNK
jgi:multiple sugar transport system substrate-binding protein